MGKQLIDHGILSDTLRGLRSEPKYLLSKYFYDDRGTAIFRDIMNMPEYYLTDCEAEIFSHQKQEIIEAFTCGKDNFNVIELGSGDGFKTRIVLRQLLQNKAHFTYMPVDISEKANHILCNELQQELSDIRIEPVTADYMQHIRQINGYGNGRKVVLFLGSNIGNFHHKELKVFLSDLSSFTSAGDYLLIGFDLKKSPAVIMDAYNDPHGHTKRFNLNLLDRLNWELDAEFDLRLFEHHAQYNPLTGEVKSYLVSQKEHKVRLGVPDAIISFNKWEAVFTELSQKFDMETISRLAKDNGFRVKENFTDSRNYFVDSLWERI